MRLIYGSLLDQIAKFEVHVPPQIYLATKRKDKGHLKEKYGTKFHRTAQQRYAKRD